MALEPQPQQQEETDRRTRNVQGSAMGHNSTSLNSWRKPREACSENSSGLTIRRKFHFGYRLSAVEKAELSMPPELLEILSSKGSLYSTMNELNSKTLKTQMDDFKKEEAALDHVKQEMLTKYPECNVIPYGTRLLGMAHPEAAIYMFFDVGNSYFQHSNHRKDVQTQIRQALCEIMRNCGHCSEVNDWDKQELVTFRHNESQMNCVVSFMNGLKDQNTQLLKAYLKIDKRLRLLTLLITRMVYKYHDISKYFTSYVLNIMVIMYLQKLQDPVLPTLMKLRESFPYEKVFIGDYDCGFPKDFSLPASNQESVETLLKGFCLFYKNFNYTDDVISILGPELKRSMFSSPFNPAGFEEPLNSFFIALKKGDISPKMNCDQPVIVQDPFELNCNTAEKVNFTVLEVFQMMCSDAYEILSKWC